MTRTPIARSTPGTKKAPAAEPKPKKGPRLRKCANRACRGPYTPDPKTPFKNWCSDDCGTVLALEKLAKAKAVKAKADRAATRQAKEATKRRADFLKEAQAAVNAYVRERDADKPCISCGRHHDGQNHAGHFLSTGARPGLRFHEMNIHKQCMPCNVHLSGNLINYRLGLVNRIGLAAVEALECDDRARKYTVDELQEIKATYQAKLRQLRYQRQKAD